MVEVVNMYRRGRPKPSIDRAIIKLWANKEKHDFDIDILEIGCMRMLLNHDVDDDSQPCCLDGHSSFLFARTGWKTVCVDIDASNIKIAKVACEKFNNVKFVCKDALDFAREMLSFNPPSRIGLLYLDAWDLDSNDSAVNHLEFYNILKPKLNEDCLILVDDTDLVYENGKYYYANGVASGKGRLLVPELERNGYKVLYTGRQTLLEKL